MLSFASVLMLSGDGLDWKQKAIPEWDDQDARNILADSPWVKKVHLEKVRDLSKFERRDGGNWEAGAPETLGPFTPDSLFLLTSMFDPKSAELAKELVRRLQPDLGSVWVRWESALPVRAAERKAGDVGSPSWDGDYYAISVNDVIPPFRWNLANELKGDAYLEHGKKKGLKPARVAIVERPKGLITAVYLFPRSAEIARMDGPVRFVAQIGRLLVTQFFFPEDMELMGIPQL